MFHHSSCLRPRLAILSAMVLWLEIAMQYPVVVDEEKESNQIKSNQINQTVGEGRNVSRAKHDSFMKPK
jgi:hypothetical protein